MADAIDTGSVIWDVKLSYETAHHNHYSRGRGPPTCDSLLSRRSWLSYRCERRRTDRVFHDGRRAVGTLSEESPGGGHIERCQALTEGIWRNHAGAQCEYEERSEGGSLARQESRCQDRESGSGHILGRLQWVFCRSGRILLGSRLGADVHLRSNRSARV